MSEGDASINWDLWVTPVSILITALSTLTAALLSNWHQRKIAKADRDSKERLARHEERRDALLETADRSRIISGIGLEKAMTATLKVMGSPGVSPHPEAHQALLRVRLICTEDLYQKALKLHDAAVARSTSLDNDTSEYEEALRDFTAACQEYLG